MKKFLNEFKEFATRGNVVDLAVGVVIGGAFGKIVSSLVADLITPVLGVLLAGVNFAHLRVPLQISEDASKSVYLNYGNFLQVIFDFIIIAFAIFLVVKLINSAKREEAKKAEEAPSTPTPSREEELLTEIRDLLKK